MNDEFLHQLYEEPEQEFTKNLRLRLTQSFNSLSPDANLKLRIHRPRTVKRMVLALAALSLVFALVTAISPPVRAAVNDIIKTIILRGVTIWVRDDVPAIKGEGESYSDIWTPVSPTDISTNYPEFAKLPMWIPASYVLQARAALFASPGKEAMAYSTLFEWKNSYGDTIQLKVSKGSCPNGQLWESGAPRSDCAYSWGFTVDTVNQPELITIHGQPAILFPRLQLLMDLSNPVQQWNPYRVRYDNRDPEAFFLVWESGGMRYEVAARSRTISKKDLIRFVESLQ